jgi:hypothetical protein
VVYDFVDERDLKIERQKKKKLKLKNELVSTRQWLKMSMVFGLLYVGIILVFFTMIFSNGSTVQIVVKCI